MTKNLLLLLAATLITMGAGCAKQNVANNQTGAGNQMSTSTKTATDSASGVSFQYPADLGTEFVRMNGSPQIHISNQLFTCDKAQIGIGGIRSVEQRTIGNYIYCVLEGESGAAGTMYRTYSYQFSQDKQMVTFDFTLEFPSCGNVDEPASSKCKTEQTAFDVDKLVDRMAKSITMGTVTTKSLDEYIATYKKSPIKLSVSQVKQMINVFSLGFDKCLSVEEMCGPQAVKDGLYLGILSLYSDAGWNDGKEHTFYLQYGAEGGPIYFGPFTDTVSQLNQEASLKANLVTKDSIQYQPK